MTQAGVQHFLAMAIVAVAAFYVARQLWKQSLAFRGRPRRRPAGGRPPADATGTGANGHGPLIQIQTRPPVHLKRPPSDET